MFRNPCVAGRKAGSVRSSSDQLVNGRRAVRHAAIETLEERRLLSISLAAPQTTTFGGDTLGQMVPVNLDGNNATDLLVSVTASGSGSIDRVLLGDPGQGLVRGSNIGQPALTDLAPIATGDFNADGFPDFVQAFESSDGTTGYISMSVNNGDGTFFRPQIPQPVVNNPVALAVADFNNDHIPDIIVSNNADRPSMSLYLGDGIDGRFHQAAGFYTNQLVTNIVTGDLNNDGNIDMATPQGIFYGQGDGTFKTPLAYPAGGGSENIVAADFNNDGKLDLALAGGPDQPSQAANITLLLNNGDKTFTVSTLNVGTGLTGIVGMATGVLQIDSFNDLVVTLGAGGGAHANQVAVLPSNGDGTFGSALFFNTGVNAGPVVVAPFNGGVRNDVAVLDQANATVSVLSNASFLDAQISLTSSNLNSVQGEVVQLSANVIGGQASVPTGTVTFFDGQTAIGTVNILPSGLAPLLTTPLAPGASWVVIRGASPLGSTVTVPMAVCPSKKVTVPVGTIA